MDIFYFNNINKVSIVFYFFFLVGCSTDNEKGKLSVNDYRNIEQKRFINQLENLSPQHDGVPIRNYIVKDLDSDGVEEIIEVINTIEEEAPGLLNSQLLPAFEFHKVYKFHKADFIEDYSGLDSFLKVRIEHYDNWIYKIENPNILSDDSKSLIHHNHDKFKSMLIELKEKVEQNISELQP